MGDRKGNLLIGNIARVLSANFWVAIIGLAGSFIFPKILTIESYALYHTFTLYIEYIGILHLGFPSGMVINYAGQDYKNINREQYKSELLLLLTILCGFTICFGVVFWITGNKMVVYIMTAVIPVGVINSYRSLCQAWSKFKTYTKISMVISTVVPVGVLLYYLVVHDLTGDVYICVYLLVYWVVAVIILLYESRTISGVISNSLFSRINWNTEKTGLTLVIGNYINTLFISIDKQFVKWFFGTVEFAYYSFAMSMQAIMTVFITSIAQPLFPAMAQGKFSDEEYNNVKELLFVFGSLSGCAYFATSIIVKLFIQKYINSLQIVSIYFVVFPALAVINCLYINLYKIKGMMKTYIATLSGILVMAIVLNIIFVLVFGHFTGVAIATTITYYIWMIVGIKQFKYLKLSVRDITYLTTYVIGFYIITRTLNDYLGFVIYFCFIGILALVCYGKKLLYFINRRNG